MHSKTNEELSDRGENSNNGRVVTVLDKIIDVVDSYEEEDRLEEEVEVNDDALDRVVEKEVNEKEGETLEKCFDLAIVDRLIGAATRIEGDNKHEINPVSVNVIATQKTGFERREIVQDLLEEAEPKINKEYLGQPIVELRVLNEPVKCLIDTGSEVCAVSQNLVNELPNSKQIVKMPVSGLNIVVATGKTKKTVKQEVFLPIAFKEVEIRQNFLVINGLSVDILVGADFLNKYEGWVNFSTNDVMVKIKAI
ncbi:uncharacterized protein LOC126268043 [Schistocerca gregaria]|uniref:uncharacterized protein LOC126268043 n=1 Tax=Schistocerca gregaria TaxID=7010 RepID=UPI00211E9BBF|nr:uncharacterized protein LOC126268043 [Schistocerca gregaria]